MVTLSLTKSFKSFKLFYGVKIACNIQENCVIEHVNTMWYYHCNSSPLSAPIIGLFYREYFLLALLIYSSSSPVFVNHTCHGVVSLWFQCVCNCGHINCIYMQFLTISDIALAHVNIECIFDDTFIRSWFYDIMIMMISEYKCYFCLLGTRQSYSVSPKKTIRSK